MSGSHLMPLARKIGQVLAEEGVSGLWWRVSSRIYRKANIYSVTMSQEAEASHAEAAHEEFELLPMTRELLTAMGAQHRDELSTGKEGQLAGRLAEGSTDEVYVVIDRQRNLLGYYCLSFGDNWDAEIGYLFRSRPASFFLFDCYTFAACRGRGAYGYAISGLLREGRLRGCAAAYCTIDDGNAFSERAVLGKGFRKAGEVHCYRLFSKRFSYTRPWGA